MKTINNKTLKKYFTFSLLKITVILFLTSNMACSSDDEKCGYTTPEETCESYQANSEFAGFTVATGYSSGATSPSGVIYNTSQNSQAQPGDDWKTTTSFPQVSSEYPTNWNSAELGQIFGIAIDANENVYLASSGIYNQLGYVYDNGTNSAKIYKCSAPGWNATLFATLPTTTGNLNDIGNLAYDKVNDQLFVTNLEEGKIYRITGLNTASGTTVETYDPWVSNTAPGLEVQSEQIWGIGVNYEDGNVKVYFPRVALSLTERSIYAITLNPDGSFPVAGSEVVAAANVPGTQLAISDIAFSSNSNEMLLSERGDPHTAKVMSYSRTGTTWAFNQQYFVGANAGLDGENSAGGVDFAYKEVDGDVSADCDEFFWASGNFMQVKYHSGLVYGLEGISYAGNNSVSAASPTANQDTDLFIDYDPLSNAKGGIGDVEVFDASECFDLCDFE